MTTEAQRLASQQNGRRSLGPATAEGRLASSRNSTRHGFSGSGASLPPDMAVEHQAELKLYIAKHRPRDDYERDLLRRAALGAVRARRLAEAENAAIDENVRTALKRWDEARADEVAALAARLDAEPAEALRHLQRTAEGCDHLGDAWEDLGRVLETVGHWGGVEKRRALRLLGVDAEPTPSSSPALNEFWLMVRSLEFATNTDLATNPALCDWAEKIRRSLPDPAEALVLLTEFVRDRVAEYEELGQRLWEEYDARARDSAITRAAFDAGPEFARLHRYFKDAERLRKQALDELARLRRDESRAPALPSRNEPEPPAPSPAAARNEPEATELPDLSRFTRLVRERAASPDPLAPVSTPQPRSRDDR